MNERNGEAQDRAPRAVRKEITRRSFLQVSLGAGAVLLAGCGGGGPQNNPALQGGGSGDSGRTYDGPRVNLEFWNGLTGGDGPFMRTLVERFNGQHDNISVRMNAIVWDEYYQKLPAAVAAGEGPDVGLVHNFNLGTVAARGVLRPLEDVVEALGYTAEDFSPAVWRAGIYDGQRYGLPLDVIPFGLFYNKTLLEEAGADPDSPPRTKDELEQVLERLKERGTRGFWVDPNLPIVSWLYQSVLPQYGGSLFNEDGTRATFNSDGGVEALSWLVSLVERGYSPKDAGADSTFTAFQNSKNAFYWSGGWNITPFTETEDLSFGLAPPPRIGPELATWAASHNLVLPQNRNQDENRTQAATVFVNWLLTNSAEWAKSGQVPARKSVRESEEFTSLRWQPVLAETLPYAKFSAVVPGYDVIESRALGPALNDALLLNVEPKAALDRAAQTANGLLEENRRKYQG